MKRSQYAMVVAAVIASILSGCKSSSGSEISEVSTDSVAAASESISDSSSESISSESAAASSSVSTMSDFVPITDEEAKSLPDTDSMIDVVTNTVKEAGIQDITNSRIGNYEDLSSPGVPVYQVDILFNASSGKLILASVQYVLRSWSAVSISDFETGKCYWLSPDIAESYDLYDYQTGQLIHKGTGKESEELKNAEKLLSTSSAE